MELPWPLSAREVVLAAIAFDDIDENGEIGININSLEAGDENGLIHEPDEGTFRLGHFWRGGGPPIFQHTGFEAK
jgi:hypothetical protein